MSSPDQINKAAGQAVWKCWGCKAESGLHWWNGLSVAVCSDPDCSSAYSRYTARQAEEDAAFEAYRSELYGD